MSGEQSWTDADGGDAGDADADVMADETDDVMANGSWIIVQPQADDHCGSKMADERSIWGQ